MWPWVLLGIGLVLWLVWQVILLNLQLKILDRLEMLPTHFNEDHKDIIDRLKEVEWFLWRGKNEHTVLGKLENLERRVK